jgi:pilus assembly protein Flp/PilA
MPAKQIALLCDPPTYVELLPQKLIWEAFTARCVQRRTATKDRAMTNVSARFVTDESGVTAIEYGLIAGLITLLIILPATQIGNTVLGFFTAVLAGFNP